MKKKIRVILLVIVMLTCTLGSYLTVYGYETMTGSIKGNNVNFRKQPKIGGTTIKKLQSGQNVKIVGSQGAWYKIVLNDGKTGWVYSKYVTVNKKTESKKVGFVKSTTLNIRKGPSTNTSIVGKLKKGNKVTILQEKNNWYYITSNNKKGWIHKNYVTFQQNSISNKPTSRSFDRTIYPANIVSFAKEYLGAPYQWGANGPKSFDCSGYTYFIYKNFGINLPRTSTGQARVGKRISKNNLTMGDLVFFDTSGKNDGIITHVGLYIGNGDFIHASSGSNTKKVTLSKLSEGYYRTKYVTARRVL